MLAILVEIKGPGNRPFDMAATPAYAMRRVEATMIRVTDKLALGDDELTFCASRSSGPGGQNVNKVETRVTLHFDVAGSPSLSGEQRARILGRLRTRITKGGVLAVASQRHRTQSANRAAAVERLVELLREALRRRPVRKKTAVPRAAKERRLEAKKRRSRAKHLRSQPGALDE